ncbi:ABC transporter ATP-binding protein [Nocardia donostiensis]|uniref:ABC transporter n=1 Tax=Nocardia donostiensis TaxID=1538463 RepID=A0A1V2T9X2_9NOCA|nr:ABC transporter ATP-binding protein [Nocardia donostiensis]ONM46313.1 hypothetical protein B0T46_23850 [Nocardia donostiensis]OQS18578.1 hypothetical protein B0T44_19010 [Nocardia donostiensis]
MITALLAALGPSYSPAFRRLLVRAAIAAILQGVALALLVPLLRAVLSDDPSSGWPAFAAFAVCSVLALGAQFSAQKHGFAVGSAVARQLHARLGDAIARLPLGWFDQAKIGMLTRMNTDQVLGVMEVPAHLVRLLANGLLTPAAIVVVMAAFEPRLALALTLSAPVLYGVARWSAQRIQRADSERGATAVETANRILEFGRHQPVLRAYDGGKPLDDALRANYAADRRMLWRAVPGLVVFGVTLRLVFVGVLALGVWLLLDDRSAAPTVIAVLVLATRFVEPVATLAELGGALRLARNSLNEINEVLRTPALPEPEQPRRPDRYDVEFRDVRFGYDDQMVLNGVTCTIPERGVTALVGFSGAGKSTMTRLLARFADPDAGQIRIGGVPVDQIATDDLMSLVSIVFQDVYLFDGTVLDNVRIGDPDADEQRVLDAVTRAGLSDLHAELSTGEGGIQLSGGQRQRVSIARALLKDAPIIVLDEPSSALDPENDAIVRATITELAATKTVLVIAHRLETVTQADQVLVLADGRITEQGTHDELIAANTHYAQLWRARERARGWQLTIKENA